MCLTVDKKFGIRIAQEDIICYKVFVEHNDILTSPYRNMHYKCGKMYELETPITVKYGFIKIPYIEEGFHSFSNKKEAQYFAKILQERKCLIDHRDLQIVVVKCLIPAGTKYATGSFYEVGRGFDSFCSERIIAVEEVYLCV